MLVAKRPGTSDPVERPHPEDSEVLLQQAVPPSLGCKAGAVWQLGKHIFRADFDSANLESVEPGLSANEFLLRTQRDCEGTLNERATRTWFYFSVRGHSLNELLIFSILNLNKQGRLYSQDYRPVFWNASQPEWQPLRYKVTYRREGDDFQLRFCHRFESEEETLFAFAIPFSYQQTQDLLGRLDEQLPYELYGTVPVERASSGGDAVAASSPAAGTSPVHGGRVPCPTAAPAATATAAHTRGASGLRTGAPYPGPSPTASSCTPGPASTSGRGCTSNPGSPRDGADSSAIYYRRQLLTRSVEGRRVEVITLTDCADATGEHEPALPGVFSHDPGPPAALFRGGKRVFFVSSRVHPGETPASHMFNGMLAFLLRRTDPRAAALRRRFVFKLVPLVNPDGVAVGNYRTDTLGQNLNRFYNGVPDEKTQPSVYAIKTLLMYYAQQGLLEYYLDLHAHANKKGVFIYGNTLEDGEAHFQSLLYSKLVSMNSAVFDFIGCNYTEKNMSRPDKDGASKEGAGRVALYRETGLTHLYTVEANYNTARTLNVVAPASGEHGGRASPPCNRRFPTKFTVGTFHSVGRAILIAALDMEAANPWSRLPHSEHRGLDGLRNWLHTVLRATPETRAAHLPAISEGAVEALKGMVTAGALRVSAALASGALLRGRPTGRLSLDSYASGAACYGGTSSFASASTTTVAFGRSVSRPPPAQQQQQQQPPLMRRNTASLPVISSAAHGSPTTPTSRPTPGVPAARRVGGMAGLLDRAAASDQLSRSASLPVRNSTPNRLQQNYSPGTGGGGGGSPGMRAVSGRRSAAVSETGCDARLDGADAGHAGTPGAVGLLSEEGPSDDDGDDDVLEDEARPTSSSSSGPPGPARFRSVEPPARATTAHTYKGTVVYCSKMTEFKIPLEDRGPQPQQRGHNGSSASAATASPVGVRPSPLLRAPSMPHGLGEHGTARRPASAGSGRRTPTAMAPAPTHRTGSSGSSRAAAAALAEAAMTGRGSPVHGHSGFAGAARRSAQVRDVAAAMNALHSAMEQGGGVSAAGMPKSQSDRRYR